jgi:carbonic anhydrase
MKMLRRTTVFGALVYVLASCGGASVVTVNIGANEAYRLAEATVQRAYSKSENPSIEELDAAFEKEREMTSLPENWKIETVTETELEVQLWVPGEAGAGETGAETTAHARQAESLVVESDTSGEGTTVPTIVSGESTTTVVLGSESSTTEAATSKAGTSEETTTSKPDETTVAPTTTVVMKVALAACIIKAEKGWESSSEPCERTAEHEAASNEHATGPAHWSYDGENGPNHWGELDPTYTACADGSIQTPVDVKDTVKADLPDPVISYVTGKAEVVNNGHTIQANASAGNILTLDGVEYPFVQIHFHTPSEHTIAGKHFDAEVHFVHTREDGKIAVVGVMIEKGPTENKAWKPYVDSLGTLEGATSEVEIDWNAMLPAKHDTFRYQGSLTTPPCTEGVSWVLMQNPVQLSETQIKAFQAAYDHNNRPVQSIGSRVIQADKAS